MIVFFYHGGTCSEVNLPLCQFEVPPLHGLKFSLQQMSFLHYLLVADAYGRDVEHLSSGV